jgi:hypothetical protein
MQPTPPTEERESNGAHATAQGAGGGLVTAVPAGPPAAAEEEAATQRLPAMGPGGPGAQAASTQVMPSPSRSPGAPATAPGPVGHPARSATPLTPSLASSGREQCPVCTSPVAPDQRYCVECGQRLAPARPTLTGDPAQGGAGGSAPPPRKSRFGWGPNTTLIAGIATLLLALGVGVLIGHYSASGLSPKRAATPIVVSGLGGTGAVGTTAEAATGPTGSAATGSKSSGASAPSAHAASTKPSAAASKPANPTVQVGQKGHGQGYQHGEFTGHFFGNENEENAGEEGEEEESGSGGKKKH